MRFAEFDPRQHAAEIVAARKFVLGQWGLTADNTSATDYEHYTQPIANAHYIGMFPLDGSSRMAGFTEYFTHATRPGGYEASPFSLHVDLSKICEPRRMAHIRTIYLDERYRQKFGLYIRLYISTAMHAIHHGHDYTTLSTWKHAHYLRGLYHRMGSKLLCTYHLPNFLDDVEVYLIDLRQLVAHPTATRLSSRVSIPAPL